MQYRFAAFSRCAKPHSEVGDKREGHFSELLVFAHFQHMVNLANTVKKKDDCDLSAPGVSWTKLRCMFVSACFEQVFRDENITLCSGLFGKKMSFKKSRFQKKVEKMRALL